jgi:microcin C transport system substrate-binding protein
MGMPSEAELALLNPLRAQLPEALFTEPAYSPPVSDGSGKDRKLLRSATRLLDAAGWTVQDGVRKNAAGDVLRLELLDDSPTFERIIGPFIANLKQIGIDASLRIVDPAQYQARQEQFDYDIVPGRFVMSLTPGPSLRSLFGSSSVDQRGTPNLSGVNDPAVDTLIEAMIGAASREDLNIAGRALDRVLRAMHIWVPNWYKGKHTVAYWDVYGRPETKPPYARGVMDLWWWDADKAEKLKAEGAL